MYCFFLCQCYNCIIVCYSSFPLFLYFSALSPGDQPDSIPVVVTLVTERGQGDEMLLTGVKQKLKSLSQQLSTQVFVKNVTRFGK